MMSHDQLFKDLLQAFFREFLELFFPTVAARLDFAQVTFSMQETFTDIPTGEKRTADLVAKVTTLEGAPELILVHIEIQADHRSSFPARMSEYYMLFRLRHQLPVLPIVIYLSPGAGGLTQETHTEIVFDRTVLRFTYDAVGLPDMEADEYLDRDNPLAPALSVLMRSGPAGRLAQKLQALRRVLSSEVDEARKSLLVNIIQTYAPLEATEEAEVDALIEAETRKEIDAMLMTWEDKVIARGVVKTKRATLIRQLRHKFGELPEDLEARIQKIEADDELEALLDRVIDAKSLDEMQERDVAPTSQEGETMFLTWEDKVIARSKRDILLRQLRHKFGPLPDDIQAKAQRVETPAELDVLLDRLLDAKSLDEMQLS
jgi:hypothetical protein